MADPRDERAADNAVDLGEYCRRVEAHLARVNEGHLIRIAGTAFELVRTWALAGIPLSIVYRGIDQKVERHRAGRSKRPLRLEFCDADVRALFDDWRRAVGAWGQAEAVDARDLPPAIEERRRPSMTRQLDRAIDRLVAASGRLDLPAGLPEALTTILDDLVLLRDELRRARGTAREALIARVAAIDRSVAGAARNAAGAALAAVEAEARGELAPFRGRMPAEAWDRAVAASTDRLLREQYGLPVLEASTLGHAADGDGA